MLLFLFSFVFLSAVLIGWFLLFYLPYQLFFSSALFSLLFIAFSSVFISAIGLSNFDWLRFIVSSSLLQWSSFLSIAFLNSFSIFITSFLNSGFGRLERSVLLFFQEISLVLLTGSSSAVFSFYLYFSDSMYLGETVIYCGLGGLFLCRSIPV